MFLWPFSVAMHHETTGRQGPKVRGCTWSWSPRKAGTPGTPGTDPGGGGEAMGSGGKSSTHVLVAGDWNMFFFIFSKGISSSQWTTSYFSEGWLVNHQAVYEW